ncbi:MAG: hypothetical protein MJD61_13105 [Proteobacteria bacterium]|nr:hypothetical protein [Pseudomonadota bacterium]
MGSRKGYCVWLRNTGQCGTPAGAVCDCDINEWNMLMLNFQGDPDFQDGAPGPGYVGVSLLEIGKERPEATRARGNKLRDEKVEGWKRPLLQETREHRIKRIRQQVKELKDQGSRRFVTCGSARTVCAFGWWRRTASHAGSRI